VCACVCVCVQSRDHSESALRRKGGRLVAGLSTVRDVRSSTGVLQQQHAASRNQGTPNDTLLQTTF